MREFSICNLVVAFDTNYNLVDMTASQRIEMKETITVLCAEEYDRSMKSRRSHLNFTVRQLLQVLIQSHLVCAGFPQRRYTIPSLAPSCFITSSVNVSHPLFFWEKKIKSL